MNRPTAIAPTSPARCGWGSSSVMPLAERRARAAGALACGASTNAALHQVGLETRRRGPSGARRDLLLGADVVAVNLAAPLGINAWLAGDDAASEVS